MTSLPWSDALKLGLPVVDETHQEFVELLARAEAADDAQLPALWDRFIAHTVAHFGHEDDWMVATGFTLGNAHTAQHRAVLKVLREGAAQAARGDLGPIRKAIGELAVWFPRHAQTLDAALVLHLRGLGYDPRAGGEPEAPPPGAISA